jgi:hypothetical protein
MSVCIVPMPHHADASENGEVTLGIIFNKENGSAFYRFSYKRQLGG